MIGLLDRTNWKISVGALIVNSEGQLLLVHPTYKPGLDLPGGILMDGECPVDGLKRELRSSSPHQLLHPHSHSLGDAFQAA